jgi:hypothetical protein
MQKRKTEISKKIENFLTPFIATDYLIATSYKNTGKLTVAVHFMFS